MEELTTPVALIIMDGYGLAEAGPGNAISLARKPFLDSALNGGYPNTTLDASGLRVGLPEGQMGNSEVGHLNIGAGRVVDQELTRINKACADGSLSSNQVLVSTCDYVREHDSVLHLMGLLSDGGVHSNQEHLFALMDLAASLNVPQVFIHCFLDGRDVPPSSASAYLQNLNDHLKALESSGTTFTIASMSGRYYAMDRDKRWDRVQKAYDAVRGYGPYESVDAQTYLAASYDQGITDEFIVPCSFVDRSMTSDDAVIFFNFRPDRAREITRALVDVDFDGFNRPSNAVLPRFVCLTEYDPTIDAPIAFPKSFPSNVLADVLASNGLKQYHIAETEKYAHVTFFLNGGKEEEKSGEQRALIASPKVATYDLQPEMSEPAVTDTLVAAIDNDEADVYIVNFANCDMVGHTGVVDAAIAAVGAVDEGVSRVCNAIVNKGGVALVTADHGNADCMISEDGTPFTAHTTAPVPFILVNDNKPSWQLARERGALCDIAPTLLDIMGIPLPSEMTGKSLLVK